MQQFRSNMCGEIRKNHIAKTIKLSGWVHRKRDHGPLLFVDLRDASGICQCVIENESSVFKDLESLTLESVISVSGEIVAREPETINSELPTGEVELKISTVDVLSKADPLPMPVNSDAIYPEDIRMKYRFLDLRRKEMQDRILLRDRVISTIRDNMKSQGFTEIQTPILTAASPEGARDYLVPSRLHNGKFYALPQAPQLFKQLLMVSGFDKYFQIAPCFRDEDARADRSGGEFYQLDFEMSFVTEEEVFNTAEQVMYEVFSKFSNKKVSQKPFLRLPYAEALERFGSDKPDTRNPLELKDISKIFVGSKFKIFAGIVGSGGFVKGIKVTGGGKKGRAWFDRANSWARSEGEAGLGYMTFVEEGGKLNAKGPIANNLESEKAMAIADAFDAKADDAVFFIAKTVKGDIAAGDLAFASKARDYLGTAFELIDNKRFDILWVVDFPMFEKDAKTGKIDFSHNPFSMPQGGMEALKTEDPLKIKARQYDIVCNGVELSSGAIRNHEAETMIKAFEIAGYTAAEVEESFGGMLRAFKLGAPPHGGSAPGIERILMLLSETENIREVTAFPLNQTAQDLMLDAPSKVSLQQLKDLGIKIIDQ